MKIKILLHIGILYILCLFQTTVIDVIKIFNTVPNLFFVFVISIFLLKGFTENCIIALVYGIVLDLLLNKSIGLNAVMFLLLGSLITLFNEKIYKDNPFIIALYTLIFSFIYRIGFYLLLFLAKGYQSFFYIFNHIIIRESIYSAIISIPVFYFVRRMYSWFDGNEKTHTRL